MLPCIFEGPLSNLCSLPLGCAHKHPWHSKSKESHPICKESDNHPGARASLDHLVSTQPGLIPQISGRLTCMQVNGATFLWIITLIMFTFF
jgi:hypothetical protein